MAKIVSKEIRSFVVIFSPRRSRKNVCRDVVVFFASPCLVQILFWFLPRISRTDSKVRRHQNMLSF